MPLLHRREAAQKLKMYVLSSGGGSFCRRRFSSSPWPSLAAARSAGRTRSRAVGVPPAAPAPLGRLCALPPFGRRRFAPVAAAACSVLPSGKGAASRCAALALVCALAGLVVGLALVGRGACGSPLAAPSGFAALPLPRRGLLRGLRPRLFVPPCPAEKRFLSPLRRRRGDAAAAAFLRRLRVCEASLRSSVYSEQLSERATTERLLILSGE